MNIIQTEQVIFQNTHISIYIYIYVSHIYHIYICYIYIHVTIVNEKGGHEKESLKGGKGRVK